MVDRLRGRMSNAAAVVICQIKPMQLKDVTPFNELLNEYLCAQGGTGYGSRTQIRMNYLRHDGYHVLPDYLSVLDKQYACALLNVPVPCPTPLEDFVPNHVRQQYRRDWPALGGGDEGLNRIHGWRW